MKKISMLLFIIVITIFGMAFHKIEEKPKKVIISGKAIGVSTMCNNNCEEELNNYENIGIMTYIDESTNQFILLGHGLYSNGRLNNVQTGNCYEINNLNIIKSNITELGLLNATLNTNNKIGVINENTKNGVYGTVLDSEEYYDKNLVYEIASKFEVKKGNAQICLDLFGDGLKMYDIEIEKINYFNNCQNIYLKIIDPELLEITGGVVKGISGSPIIQNEKLIGAVNYGTDGDITRGCAIFADKL